MRKKDVVKTVALATGDIFGSIADVFLFQTFLAYTIAGKHTQYEVDSAFRDAQLLLSDINHRTIARSLYTLCTNHLLKRVTKKGRRELEITESGKRRINELIPSYKTKRPWDEYLYLVSYDIPTTHNNDRNTLRQYLHRIGCALLQESLWITPYNPHGIVEDFIKEHDIPGTILVSKLGKDGSIGDENTQTMINRVYGLEELKNRYETFIKQYRNHPHMPLTQIALDYYAILRDDPQLPFDLEPSDFPAKKANEVFQKNLR